MHLFNVVSLVFRMFNEEYMLSKLIVDRIDSVSWCKMFFRYIIFLLKNLIGFPSSYANRNLLNYIAMS